MGDILSPSPPKPPPPPKRRKPPARVKEIKSEPLIPDASEAAAATRNDLAQRRGRTNLRINRSLPGSGLSIPQ